MLLVIIFIVKSTKIIKYLQRYILCSVYSVLNGSEQLFASRYKFVLPTNEELKRELEREREIISEELSLNDY